MSAELRVIQGAPWLGSEGWRTPPLLLDDARIEGGHRPPRGRVLDLSGRGVVVVPGLVNGHDHLDFGLCPLLAPAAPYRDYVEWAEDVTARRRAGELRDWERIPLSRRLLHSALRNLRSGVAAVAHMNPWCRAFDEPTFPLEILGDGLFHHSLVFGGDLGRSLARIGSRRFMIHVAEGTGPRARAELDQLRERGGLTDGAVLVHGTPWGETEARIVAESGACLVACPASNRTLYHATPDLAAICRGGLSLALGSDSPISGPGDLLADLNLAREAGLSSSEAWHAVTEAPARRFGRSDLGRLAPGCSASLLLVDASDPELRQGRGSVHLVVVRGRPRLARRSGLIAAWGVEERPAGPGLWLDAELQRWCEREHLLPLES